MNIGFIGLGKLGLDCAEVFAQHYKVRGFDVVPRTSDTVEVCDINTVVRESNSTARCRPPTHKLCRALLYR